MRLPDFQYVEPESLEEASLFLRDEGKESKLTAGGTDLLPSMKQRLFRPKYLIALDNIPDLDGIDFDGQAGLRIGALVKIRTLETDPLIRDKYPSIGQAAHAVGSVQLRQMGTVGGNLCLDTRCTYYNQTAFWRSCRPRCIKMGGDVCNAIGGGKKCFAVFSGDLAPALIALDARVKILSSRGERTLPLNDLYTGDGARPAAIDSDEILTAVEVPVPSTGTFELYLKYRIRQSIDFPLAGVATRLAFDGENGICREAKVVIGAVGTRPQEVAGIGELLAGKRLDAAIIEEASDLANKAAKPVANASSTPTYRRWITRVYVKKALDKAMEEVF